MPDTGQAAGQQAEFAVRLTQSGAALSYANAAAFEGAGWTLLYRAAQTAQVPSYTLSPWTEKGDGWHLVVLTLIDGQGPASFKKPTSGVGWKAFPEALHIAAESTDNDDTYSAILQSVGVAPAETLTTTYDFNVREGDSLTREVSILETAVTIWGWTAEQLADGTLTLDAAVRAAANRVGQPNGWMQVTVKTAVTGDDPVLRLSWITFPAARTSIQDGMEYASVDPTNDADLSPTAYNYDVQATGSQTWAITAVSTVSKTFTVSGDRRRWFSKGGQFTVDSGANAGTYTVTAIAYAGGNTTVTVVETVTSAVVAGNVVVTVRFTVLDGTVTVPRQETRT
jgi:hypothetical protein